MKHQPIGRRRFLQGSAALIGGHSLAAGMPLPAQVEAANGPAPKHADRFAAIALQPAAEIRGRLVENPPPIFPKVELEAERNSPSVDFPLRPLMHTREEFRAALAELRQQYEPFLADYTPPMPATRARVELDAFQFRLEEPDDLRDFSRVGRGEGSWQNVRLPDYRGPVGWWAGYYRKVLDIPPAIWKQEAVLLRFGAVDYKCQVYLNGRLVTTHEGFFAPFEVDVTPYLRRDGENILVVRFQNESIMLGVDSWSGTKVDGDKIYAATGVGWDDPVLGWHACPPGAGIWQKVYLEGRPKLAIAGFFVQPDLENKAIELRVEVDYRENVNRELDLTVSIYPKNFHGPALENLPIKAAPAGPSSTEYRATLYLGDFRTWEPGSPYLYTVRATVRPKDGGPVDVAQDHFGMREFRMDDTSAVKGTLYLNGEPVILRGADTMGNFEVPAMKGEEQQLIEDILIAKLAHMNFFRLTQTPVQPEVYDMFDRLGMMAQTDLPLFGLLRRPQLVEAIRQAGEMEKLVRNHPSNIMISYINEPTNAEKDNVAHRDLTRPELELFFEAASSVVHVHNPARVIKTVDGDYDPPEPGLPDNHIYCAWYGSHALPIGKFMRGYWVNAKAGWKHGSGEYGVEGLEDADTMFKYYPKDWLPAAVNDHWSPDKIPYAQTWTMHGSWYDTQETMAEWIAASQAHQAWGIGTMTRAFRRQTDRIVS
ncbi:MAG: sugar-binding domain-containing protein [Terriglobia bacterium]|jgi:beta-galactosidase/beta-glucuronidase